jgi:hypothetical protein
MTDIDTRERHRRVADAWARRPNATREDIERQVDQELELEAAQAAEQSARAEELSASYTGLTTCGVPHCGRARLALTGLCETHSHVLFAVEADVAGAETLPDGRTVREWVAELAAERRKGV